MLRLPVLLPTPLATLGLLYVLLSTPTAMLGARNTGSLLLNFVLASAVIGSHSHHIYWLPTVAHQGSFIVDTLLALPA